MTVVGIMMVISVNGSNQEQTTHLKRETQVIVFLFDFIAFRPAQHPMNILTFIEELFIMNLKPLTKVS